MLHLLPSDIISFISDYLHLSDICHLKYICKLEFSISYKVYSRTTKYINNGNESFQTSYLLTNGIEELPTQIKHNFVEIKLYHGRLIYHFTLFKNIYNTETSILSYLKQYDRKLITKNTS